MLEYFSGESVSVSIEIESPFETKPIISVGSKLGFSGPFRKEFIDTVRFFNEDDLSNNKWDS